MYDKSDLEIKTNRIILKVWNKDKTHFNYSTLIEILHGDTNERKRILELTFNAISK